MHLRRFAAAKHKVCEFSFLKFISLDIRKNTAQDRHMKAHMPFPIRGLQLEVQLIWRKINMLRGYFG
jgi:hypothetical protein